MDAKTPHDIPEDAEGWNKHYRDKHTPWDVGHPSLELQRCVAEHGLKPCAALELGCGTGTNAVWLTQQGFTVTGVDISPLAIAQAEERSRAAGVKVRWITGDLRTVRDLGGPSGFLFDRGCYHAVRRSDVNGYLDVLRRELSPGAAALIIAGKPRPQGGEGPPVVTEEEIRAELGRVATIGHLREFTLDNPAGSNDTMPAWSCWLHVD